MPACEWWLDAGPNPAIAVAAAPRIAERREIAILVRIEVFSPD
ncbi:MAG TPA: hypothetical protein VNZ58_08870 [Thermomicrobiales bacterium]|nr:hypothetical protein [Thermomicrobiales bacterium]